MNVSVMASFWKKKEKEKRSLLQESGLVLVLHVGSELDLSLDPRKLTGFIKGDGVGSIQYIIPSLEETWGRE